MTMRRGVNKEDAGYDKRHVEARLEGRRATPGRARPGGRYKAQVFRPIRGRPRASRQANSTVRRGASLWAANTQGWGVPKPRGVTKPPQ